jgi:hypothetical protein
MKKLTIFLIFIITSSVIQAEALKMGFPMAENTRGSKIAKAIAIEISKRTGQKINSFYTPRKRVISLLKKKSLNLDGVLMMYDGLDTQIKGLIKVSEIFLSSPIVAISNKTDIKINGWKSLKAYSLAQPAGGKFITKNLAAIGLKAHPVRKPESGLKFILAGRADVFLAPPIMVKKLLKQKKYVALKILKPNVAVNRYYSYFSSRKADAANAYQKALLSMKKDGTYKAILKNIK